MILRNTIKLVLVLLISGTALHANDQKICGRNVGDAVVPVVSAADLLRSETWLSEGKIQYLSTMPALRMSVTVSLGAFFSEDKFKLVLVAPDEKNRMVVAVSRSSKPHFLLFFVKEGADFDQLVGDFVRNLPEALALHELGVFALPAYGSQTALIGKLKSLMTALDYTETAGELDQKEEMVMRSRDYSGGDLGSTLSLILRGFSEVPTTDAAMTDDVAFANATELFTIQFLSGP